MVKKRIPNLFIVGAAKCGTTAMSHFLAGHPDIFMSEQAGAKEPNFYDRDILSKTRRFTSLNDYLALFDSAPESSVYLGEASPIYLYSKTAINNIFKASPYAKIIVMLRNPLGMARSLHNQRIKDVQEPVTDFERAWHLQNQRARGIGTPGREPDTFQFQYGPRANLGQQLQRLFFIAPRKQIHVVIYDDLVTDAGKVYADVLAFLELEPSGATEFPVMNASVQYRASAVQSALVRMKRIRKRLGIPGGVGIHAAINRINTSKRPSRLRPEFLRELQDYFREDVDLLSDLLNRDLSHWVAAE